MIGYDDDDIEDQPGDEAEDESAKAPTGLDLDYTILSAILGDDEPYAAMTKAMAGGVSTTSLDGDASKILAFLGSYIEQNAGEVPGRKDLEKVFGVYIEPTGFSLDFLLPLLARRTEFRTIADGLSAVEAALEGNDPDKAKQALLGLAGEVDAIKSSAVQPTNLHALGHAVIERYDQAHLGMLGYPCPWPSVNAMTSGWVPGTNSWFVARPGVGKTWLAILCGRHVWRMRLDPESVKMPRVLIVSPEMAKVDMAERFFTIDAKVPYGEVVAAKLTIHAESKWKTMITEASNQDGLFIIDATDNLTPDSIAEAIEAVKADFVVIDAAYRIKWNDRAKDRFENFFYGVEIISNWSKRKWSGGRKIAIVADSQLNRSGAGKGSKSTTVALSDNLVWEADNLFAATVKSKTDGVLTLNTEKVRRMAAYKEKVPIRWDMEQMEFGEIDTEINLNAGAGPGQGAGQGAGGMGGDDGDIPF